MYLLCRSTTRLTLSSSRFLRKPLALISSILSKLTFAHFNIIFSSKCLEKHPWEWTEEDIISLIRNEVKESLILDYKRCDSLAKRDEKRRELSKGVSAFANSAGGTIVYGIIETGDTPEKIDVGYDPNEISREWIENVIMTNTQPRIDGIRINQVALAASWTSNYVVHIPQSKRAPHMAADNRYYEPTRNPRSFYKTKL